MRHFGWGRSGASARSRGRPTGSHAGVAAAVLFSLVAVALSLGATRSGAQSVADVDVALVLAVDCSYSVDATEFRQQMSGLANAFRDPAVQAAISAGPRKAVAISVMQWSGATSQAIVVPWRIVRGQADALRLAAEIDAAPRATAEGATSVRAAIDAAVTLHLTAPFRASKRVIDISADGYNNSGGNVAPARQRAVSVGITLNALAILNEYSYLHLWYRNNVIAGPGAFVEIAQDYVDYSDAILRKLILEISGPLA